MKPYTLFLSDLFELTKPRICLLALTMASLGYFLGSSGPVPIGGLTATLFGMALVGAAAGILNQYLEKEVDARMWRTMERPLPAGRLTEGAALVLGLATAFVGEMILMIAVNPMTAVLGAVTLLFYLGIYTPSKQFSPASTLIGAVPGALPPLMGWTAARGSIGAEGLLLFAILFLWQIPHFLAIGWLYREDYARAQLPILSVVDRDGGTCAKQVMLYSIALLPLTLLPSVWGIAGRSYFYGAIALNVLFLAFGFLLARYRTLQDARRLFVVSVFYLPALGLLMVWDRIPTP